MMFAVFFCEYLNLPGFPAGVIMPAVGVLLGKSELMLSLSLIVSISAGLAGCLVIYLICYYGGAPLLHKLFGKSKKYVQFVEQSHKWLNKHEGRGLFICRLIPVLRTIVSIPAGLLRIPLRDYMLWSAAGIAIWNSVLICAGFLFGEAFL